MFSSQKALGGRGSRGVSQGIGMDKLINLFKFNTVPPNFSIKKHELQKWLR